MPNRIDLLASTNTNLGATLQNSLSALRANNIHILATGEIISTHATPFARILLRDLYDKSRALQVLTVAGIDHPALD